MRRLKLLGLALAAVCALLVVMAASASAVEPLPSFLPGTAQNFTAEVDEANPKFETVGGLSVTCEKAPSTGTLELNKPLGLFHVAFGEKCKDSTGTECNGLSDTAGRILVLGTWHLVIDDEATLGVAVLFLIEPVHFSCGALTLVEVTGSVECLVLEPLLLMKLFLIHCIQEKGKQKEVKYVNDAGTLSTASLKASVNHTPAVESGELALALINFEKEVEIDH
jgi:hypothetical protein